MGGVLTPEVHAAFPHLRGTTVFPPWWQPCSLWIVCCKPENISTSGMLQTCNAILRVCFLVSCVIPEAASRLSLSFIRAGCHKPLADEVAGLFLERGLGSPRVCWSRPWLLLFLLQCRSFVLLSDFYQSQEVLDHDFANCSPILPLLWYPGKIWKQTITEIVFKLSKIKNALPMSLTRSTDWYLIVGVPCCSYKKYKSKGQLFYYI